jgi:polyisoprenoid-binding protein YceI/mono/diheme cytochrome c family protein
VSLRSRLGGAVRHPLSHPWFSGVAVVVVVVGGVGVYSQVRSIVDPPYRTTSYDVPSAPRLTAGPGETVYRIDPTRSKATYSVDEEIVGRKASTATGSTQGIAGDLALDPAHPSAARVGQIVVDVEQFHSDSSLRDARIRSDFLESHQYPLARFTTRSIDGLPASVRDGQRYRARLHGDLEVKGTTKPVTWAATARLSGHELRLDATATVKLSDFGAGPISIIGLVSTSDRATLTLHVVAADPTATDIPDAIPDPTAAERASGGPSFARAVKPILEQNCVGCHRSGQIGADVWTLDDAGDAAQVASGIETVTASRYMPPWPPSSKGVPVQHPRGLTPAQIATLASWADHGGRLDVPASTKLHDRSTKEPNPPRHDLVLKMSSLYAGDGTQVNDYRCFLLDPKFTTPTYVTGSEFLPGNPKIVHHALIYRTAGSARAELDALDGADGRPGWSCGLGGVPTGARARTTAARTGGQDGPGGGRGGAGALRASIGGGRTLFAGWVPGQRPRQAGPNMGFLFEPGDLIVMQIHYHYDRGVLADRSSLALQTQAPTPGMHNLVTSTPVAPVELPCPASQSANPLCDRTASLADEAQRYGPLEPAIPGVLLRLCGAQNVTSDPISGNGTSQCDSRVRTDGNLVDFMGHMHTRGKSFTMTLDPGTPQEKVLLDIPAWNFDWQINYQPQTPIPVHRGDVIRIRCTWDRSQVVDPSPRYITFAEGTEDEMCFSTYTIDPTQPTGVGPG